jgi:hypothetical protein
MEQIRPNMPERRPSSRALKDLLDQAPADYFTLGWLMSTLHQRSFGLAILFLALLSTVPIGSTLPGLLLLVVAAQMIAGRREPAFPYFITGRPLSTRYLFNLGERTIPVLRYLEKAVHPRWPKIFEAARHFVGVIVLLLTVALLLTPVPLSNIAPAVVVAVIALAYIEEDGLLLLAALFAGIVLIVLGSAAVWGTIVGALAIIRVW